MSKTHPPELKKYMDKRLSLKQSLAFVKERGEKGNDGLNHFQSAEYVKINGGRHVTGVLRGFDPFMNLVLDEAVEEVSAQEKHNIGMVVIRGNSIVIMEALDRIS